MCSFTLDSQVIFAFYVMLCQGWLLSSICVFSYPILQTDSGLLYPPFLEFHGLSTKKIHYL